MQRARQIFARSYSTTFLQRARHSTNSRRHQSQLAWAALSISSPQPTMSVKIAVFSLLYCRVEGMVGFFDGVGGGDGALVFSAISSSDDIIALVVVVLVVLRLDM